MRERAWYLDTVLSNRKNSKKQRGECDTENGPGMLLTTVGFILKAGGHIEEENHSQLRCCISAVVFKLQLSHAASSQQYFCLMGPPTSCPQIFLASGGYAPRPPQLVPFSFPIDLAASWLHS